MKFAGYDHVIVTGKSNEPVYLSITPQGAELKSAKGLWGKTTFETEERVQKELGDQKVRVACIGPAGEKLVRGSAILVDRAKAAGGSGVGCVMGSKNLKVIAVRGHGSMRVANPAAFRKALDGALQKIKFSENFKKIQQETMAGAFYADENASSWDLLFVVRNGQDDYFEIEKRRKIMNRLTGAPSYRKKVLACFGCPIGCMPFSEISEGRYRGTKGEGFWINPLMSASMVDLQDPDAILKAWLLMNELGLDGDFAASMAAWACECFERGLLRKRIQIGFAWNGATARPLST